MGSAAGTGQGDSGKRPQLKAQGNGTEAKGRDLGIGEPLHAPGPALPDPQRAALG